jgi:hypothetical protein
MTDAAARNDDGSLPEKSETKVRNKRDMHGDTVIGGDFRRCWRRVGGRLAVAAGACR